MLLHCHLNLFLIILSLKVGSHALWAPLPRTAGNLILITGILLGIPSQSICSDNNLVVDLFENLFVGDVKLCLKKFEEIYEKGI